MALDVAQLTTDLEALWQEPDPLTDQVTELGVIFEKYYSGASLLGVPPVVIPGVTQPGLLPLRIPIGGNPVTASLAFALAVTTMVVGSVFPPPASGPAVPNPIPLNGLLLPLMLIPSAVSIAPAFAATLDGWMHGVLVPIVPMGVPTPII